jgi:hypothetical protein
MRISLLQCQLRSQNPVVLVTTHCAREPLVSLPLVHQLLTNEQRANGETHEQLLLIYFIALPSKCHAQ